MGEGVKIRDEDHGYDALLERVFKLSEKNPQITVGIHEDVGSEAHEGGDATILEIGIYNEFGTENEDGSPRIPARSFIRAWFDEQEGELREDLVKLAQSVVAGDRTAKEVLEIMGQRMVGQIQERMAAGIDPENAPATIKKKGSSTPLIDTGVLRSSISYRVDEG